ncbi:YceI family protein [Flavobacterium paronense]|uniref:YceI family protein n=1 Tax=Flavobacterium paronense TaxID=1392775 RepID=A0ABV5GA47_9FLAO|nr:YceI family protein [Flavobacterium paronense]MDN3677341.1 YceI family protein [Flavobacterium paronense]
MKNLKTIAIALLVAFSSTVATAQTKKINVEKSTINWNAKKVTGEHSGTVNFQDGNLIFKSGKLVGGSFTVDMTSLKATDLSGDWKTKLEGHLNSEDFFSTEKFKTSTLAFKKIATKANGVYTITADLTIKGITNPVTFDLTVKGNAASTVVKIDRTKYDIKYGSKSFFDSIGDKAINDDFDLTVNLQF